MAEYLIKFDTKEKTLTVTKDGVQIPNVACAEVCRSDYYGYGYGGDSEEEEDFRFALTQMESDKENDTKQMIRTVANQAGDLVPAEIPEEEKIIRTTAKIRKSSNKAVADIQEYFKERL